jgi:signal transduction histidine kinase
MEATVPDAPRRAARQRALAWVLFGLAVVEIVVGLVLTGVKLAAGTVSAPDAISTLAFLPAGVTFSAVGLIVALRRSANPAGWFMLVIGAFWSLLALPIGDSVDPQWFGSLIWVVPLGLMGIHLLLRLPDGRLPSVRWRWVSRIGTVAIVLVGVAIPPEDSDATTAIQDLMGFIGILLLLGAVVASVASLVVRARRADADERHQLRWIAAGGLVFLVFWGLAVVPGLVGVTPSATSELILNSLGVIAYSAVPLGIGIAILKYRLYAIDVVIRKALILAGLAAFFTAVYILVVGGVGALVGSRSTPALSFVAAAVVAVGFQPALARARRFADRVVYGKRSTPYEVLAELGERLGETYASDDDLTVEVRHQGDPLGALSVAMPANDPMDPTKERLMSDLAAQAGLVLRNVGLTEELRQRIEDLRAAQKRLVSAQDAERRRLERNIHDGAQQQLVALSVKIRLAGGLLDRDTQKAREILDQLQSDTGEALEDLRDLARGIYPPLLADQGLAPALAAQARKASLPVEVRADGIGRFPQEVEAAAYFSCLEALQNVAKYAHASRAVVTLSDGDGRLRFEVTDDGAGFDPSRTGYGTGLQGIADRLGALAGTLSVSSSARAGTTVTGLIPVAEAEPAG